MITERSREQAMEFLRSTALPSYELEGWLPIDLANLLDRVRAEERQEHSDFLAWLDAEIEAARQLNRQDPIATRTALERVKARIGR